MFHSLAVLVWTKLRPMRLVALLRAVNVGGAGLLSMAALRAVASDAGLRDARTVGQSGNLVFTADMTEAVAAAHLSGALAATLGRAIDLVVRDTDTLRSLLAADPFPDADPSKVLLVFTRDPPPSDGIPTAGPGGERLAIVCSSTLVVHYPDGMGRSRLVLPAWARAGTARNLRTVAKLAG